MSAYLFEQFWVITVSITVGFMNFLSPFNSFSPLLLKLKLINFYVTMVLKRRFFQAIQTNGQSYSWSRIASEKKILWKYSYVQNIQNWEKIGRKTWLQTKYVRANVKRKKTGKCFWETILFSKKPSLTLDIWDKRDDETTEKHKYLPEEKFIMTPPKGKM